MAPLHLPKLSFQTVLASFLVLMLLPPYLEKEDASLFMEIAINLNLLACLFLVARNKRQLVIGGILAATAVLGGLYSKHPDTAPLIYTTCLFYLAYLAFICVHLLRLLLLNQGSVELILASICFYLILGLMWALIYVAIELADPGSFALGEVADRDFNTLFFTLFYYSFVTLSTLGYGDLLPLSNQARGWAITEAIVGQFYFAIVVARLLSQALSTREEKQKAQHEERTGVGVQTLGGERQPK